MNSVPEETNCHIFTRADLADASMAQKPVVLLTGRWRHGPARSVVELDAVMDRRFLWIDREAERLAEIAGGTVSFQHPFQLSNPWVNVLALRYYVLRLLRVIVFFTEVRPLKQGDRVRMIAPRADRDDVAILTTLCRRAGAECRVDWQDDALQVAPAPALKEEWWRRSLRYLASQLGSSTNGAHSDRPKVVLYGNPRFLDPLCRVLRERDCRQWWLYDRFAVKPFFQWHSKGVDQLTCQENVDASDEGKLDPLELPTLEFQGLDLRGLVADWLETRLVTRRDDQRRWRARIDDHFREIRPDLLVMDEDATPMKRIALAIARRYGGKSYVVQHGAPVARFGFAPLAADGFFAWGRSTREQLEQWDIPSDRIFVTGSPTHDVLHRSLRQKSRETPRSGGSPRILLLATVPPRDDRPDLIEMNLTSRTYSEMIEAAFAAAEAIPEATLVVKPHPRAQGDPVIRSAIARHPKLGIEMARTGSLAKSLRGVDCVLSCLSSAGIEATLAGVPVIQLMPRGAGQVLPHDRWGMLGSASSAAELNPLIQAALQGDGRSTNASLGDVFANACCWGRTSAKVPDAATQIAETLLGRVGTQGKPKQSLTMSRTNREQGSSKTITSR